MPVPRVEIPACSWDEEGRVDVSAFTSAMRIVCLGRNPPEPGEAFVQIADYVDPVSAAGVPDAVDYSEKSLASIRLMYGNDRQGDCTIASGLHGLGLWSGNDTDSPGMIVGSTAEALAEYHRIGGPGDNGLNIRTVLNDFAKNGLLCGGTRHKIAGWAGVRQNRSLIQWCIAALGGMRIGFNLPGNWQRSAREGFLWSLSNANGFVGGHDVRCTGFNQVGVRISTWGVRGTMEWAAFLHPQIVDELYVEVSEDWTGPDKIAPSGFDLTRLLATLGDVNAGRVPDWVPEKRPVLPGDNFPDPNPVG